MKPKKICIIGGGISALYCALLLKIKYNQTIHIDLFERNNRLGGRILTKTFDCNKNSFTYESGAGRFSNLHKLLINLIKRYHLESQMIPLDSEFHYVGIKNTKTMDYQPFIKDIMKHKKEATYDRTMYDFLLNIWKDNSKVDEFLYQNGYKTEHYKSSARVGYLTFLQDYKTKHYYVLEKGFQQIIDCLETELKQLGVMIYTQSNIDQNRYEQMKKQYDRLIITIPNQEFIPINKYSIPIPLLRIYFLYRNPQKSLEDIIKTTTDLLISYIIPIHNRAIMISYTDGEYAKDWYQFYLQDEKKCIQTLLNQFKKIYGKTLSIPDEVSMDYWSAGVHVWAPSFHFESPKIRKKIIYPQKNVYVCNEAYSMKQGWIEGSLEMAHEVVELFH